MNKIDLSSLEKSVKTPLFALILAGGKSSRMGDDKSQIVYHGETAHEVRLADLCKPYVDQVFISKPSDYSDDKIGWYSVIHDIHQDIGPINAFISAFKKFPNAAWLVLACDLPLMNAEAIDRLVNTRDEAFDATLLAKAKNALVEPLAGIYEANSGKYFLQAFDKKDYSIRKVLEKMNTKKVILSTSEQLFNANTMDEQNEAKRIINKQ